MPPLDDLAARAPPLPVLTTPRLTLSPPEISDFDDSVAMWCEPEVYRYVGGRASTREESWARLLRARGLWALLGYGYWAVRETATGRYVGEVGFADFHRDIEPSFEGVPEMGWVLASWSHGQGFGTEAVNAGLAWGQRRWGQDPVVCIIHPDNAASLALAAKTGFVEQARTTYKDSPTVLLRRE
ncbi:GNAT family N-acetyltransferase [Caulobacter sp. 602-2]|uniref:GNAT family N-acetyltransferase n=1 Tax=Caulobacter sp. 602-2 TaxID=2710887 RepID=A0A6G4QY93_9CAUL|nr:GNAT family N-acetyltransferase [Caulobacter sp. 602-2]NGM50453.1 GNAT family N-acetyltransferase [Caulobacter sp. 602-2]